MQAHLRNLPEATALELQTIRSNLDLEQPPYRPIQDDPLPAPTMPQFQTPLDHPSRHVTLLPRAQWIRDTPPILTEEEADNTHQAACAWLFGTKQSAANQHAAPRHRDHLSTASQNGMDIRHPDHPRHAQALRIRTGISFALQHNNHLQDFRREDVPPITTCATAHATMTAHATSIVRCSRHTWNFSRLWRHAPTPTPPQLPRHKERQTHERYRQR